MQRTKSRKPLAAGHFNVRWLTVFLVVAIVHASILPAAANNTRIIDGPDGLKVIDSTDYPWHSIGRVNRAGYKTLSSCTGTLIAPNLVLTAAHCIVSRKTQELLPADEVLFIAGVRRDEHAARLEAECMLTIEGFVARGRPKVSEVHKDIALIVLKEASTLQPLPPLTVEEAKRLGRSTRFLSVGYRRSRPYLPTVVPSCSILGGQSDVWITDCNTESGASGGPLMVSTIFGPRVAGVMSAKVNDERSIVVPFLEWQDLLKSASCEQAPAAAESALTQESEDTSN